ncbi:MAG: type I glutamate--ammonia ligase [Eubacteriales bacterium]|nr:type I glutamate--ammonia ligase [Eubacteriales bacterium]
MKKYTKQDIIQLVKENDVEFIRLQFTDLFGALKNMAISASQLERALDNKCLFDGSSIEGFVRVEESDMYLYPDLDTFTILPWRPQRGKVARMICDVYRPMGIPFEGDSRYLLKKVLKRANELGYHFHVGPECEFFLFHTDENGRPTTLTHERAGYFDITPLDLGEDARRDIILTLEEMGFEVEASHHEVAPAQHEIDFHHCNALKTADNIQTFKMVVKSIAKRHGLFATFMPKPLGDVDGSGMHINFSMHRDGKNLFFDKSKPMGLSEDCLYFIAGLMKHAKAITCVCNPLVNSYKRLIPGYEAPTGIAWSEINRSPLIRIPSSRGQSTRVELRSPDSASNPYLVLALSIAAGLDGIIHKIMPPEPIGSNMYLMKEKELEELGVEKLPRTLGEAIAAMEEDPFVKEVLGEHIYKRYLHAKKKEWESYCAYVTDWEREQYLYKF